MRRKKKDVRVRFEVAGRRYEGTLGDITEQYARDRTRAGVAWPGGIARPSRKDGAPAQ